MNNATAHKCAATAFAISAFFPPFLADLPGSAVSGCGFGLLFMEKTGDRFSIPCRVDIPLLLVEWLFIAICLAVLHRRTILQTVNELLHTGQQNRQHQLMLANKKADVQCEVARIVASAIVQHAQEQRREKELF